LVTGLKIHLKPNTLKIVFVFCVRENERGMGLRGTPLDNQALSVGTLMTPGEVVYDRSTFVKICENVCCRF